MPSDAIRCHLMPSDFLAGFLPVFCLIFVRFQPNFFWGAKACFCFMPEKSCFGFYACASMLWKVCLCKHTLESMPQLAYFFKSMPKGIKKEKYAFFWHICYSTLDTERLPMRRKNTRRRTCQIPGWRGGTQDGGCVCDAPCTQSRTVPDGVGRRRPGMRAYNCP